MSKIRFLAVIQLRENSERFKKKIFKKLKKNLTSTEIIFKNIKKLKFIDKIILATGTKFKNPNVNRISNKLNVDIFYGSENNVSYRYYNIIKKYNPEFVIRITADNPFTEVEYIKFLSKKILNKKNNFVKLDNISIPYGSGVEIFRSDFFVKNLKKIKTNYEKEHVYEHLKKLKGFKVYESPKNLSVFPFRVTFDTNEDFIFLRYVYNIKNVNNIFQIGRKVFNL